MPKVYITKEGQLNSRLTALIYGTMKVKHVTQSQMANELGITQQAYAKKLKTRKFTYFELVTIFKVLEFSDDDIIGIMREKV